MDPWSMAEGGKMLLLSKAWQLLKVKYRPKNSIPRCLPELENTHTDVHSRIIHNGSYVTTPKPHQMVKGQ